METPQFYGIEKEWCGTCGACGACGACGPSHAVFIAGAALLAVSALFK